MSIFSDAIMRSTIVSVLRSPAARKIDFWFGPVHVNTWGLELVASALFRSLITCATGGLDPALQAAKYNQIERTFHFASTSVGKTTDEQSYIIHECVHAMIFLQGMSVADTHHEGAAYVAACLFLRYALGRSRGFVGTDSVALAYREADEIAGKIANIQGAAVANSDVWSLRNMVPLVPVEQKDGVTLYSRKYTTAQAIWTHARGRDAASRISGRRTRERGPGLRDASKLGVDLLVTAGSYRPRMAGPVPRVACLARQAQAAARAARALCARVPAVRFPASA
jgi:hypothetical protein